MILLSKKAAPLLLALTLVAPASAQIPDILGKSMSSSNSDEPTYVTALTMDIDVENNVTTLLGDVVVDDRDVKITCNKMIIYMEDSAKTDETDSDASAKESGGAETEAKSDAEKQDAKAAGDGKESGEGGLFNAAGGGKQVSKIHCIGDVVIIRKNIEQTENENATSDEAVFDVKTNVITMIGNPILNSGKSKMKSQKIEILLNEGGRMKFTQPDGMFFRDGNRGKTTKPGA